jgi:hypothetical protein
LETICGEFRKNLKPCEVITLYNEPSENSETKSKKGIKFERKNKED